MARVVVSVVPPPVRWGGGERMEPRRAQAREEGAKMARRRGGRAGRGGPRVGAGEGVILTGDGWGGHPWHQAEKVAAGGRQGGWGVGTPQLCPAPARMS